MVSAVVLISPCFDLWLLWQDCLVFCDKSIKYMDKQLDVLKRVSFCENNRYFCLSNKDHFTSNLNFFNSFDLFWLLTLLLFLWKGNKCRPTAVFMYGQHYHQSAEHFKLELDRFTVSQSDLNAISDLCLYLHEDGHDTFLVPQSNYEIVDIISETSL